MKALVMIRVSTETQKLEDQHREMVEFCNLNGYEDLVFVEDKGASAIKLNDSYRMMIEQVKSVINDDPDIRCLAVWELSRAFRNEGVYYEVKEFLLAHKVQFLCKNPNLRLLNDDGTVNMGMEIAMSLFATMAKQEMEIKKERFARAKRAMKEQGKFIGGPVKYGYVKNKEKRLEILESEAKVVREIFELYATGRYSVRTLYEELSERGYMKSDGKPITYHHINKMIADDCYADGVYPAIISSELWEKVKKVREAHLLSIPKGKKYVFGSGIFKCSRCGWNMIAEGTQFRCWHHSKLSAPPHCDNGSVIKVENLDGLLWWIASKEEVKYRMKDVEDRKKECEKSIEVLKSKIEVLQKKLDKIEEKRARIVDLYIEGVISKEDKEIRLNKSREEVKTYKDTILSYNEQIGAFLGQIEGNIEDVDMSRLLDVYEGVIKEPDLRVMNDIVKRHIKKVISTSYWFGKERDKRAIKENAQLIEVELSNGATRKYVYVARKYKNHYWWMYDEGGKEVALFGVKKIVREKGEFTDARIFKKMKDW